MLGSNLEANEWRARDWTRLDLAIAPLRCDYATNQSSLTEICIQAATGSYKIQQALASSSPQCDKWLANLQEYFASIESGLAGASLSLTLGAGRGREQGRVNIQRFRRCVSTTWHPLLSYDPMKQLYIFVSLSATIKPRLEGVNSVLEVAHSRVCGRGRDLHCMSLLGCEFSCCTED